MSKRAVGGVDDWIISHITCVSAYPAHNSMSLCRQPAMSSLAASLPADTMHLSCHHHQLPVNTIAKPPKIGGGTYRG
ncbi:hypothetical protein Ancab_032274 [Ancistrocladus abbreviatus]